MRSTRTPAGASAWSMATSEGWSLPAPAPGVSTRPAGTVDLRFDGGLVLVGTPDQLSAVTVSSSEAKRSLAAIRRVGTCSVGTSTGASTPSGSCRATVTLCTSSGPS